VSFAEVIVVLPKGLGRIADLDGDLFLGDGLRENLLRVVPELRVVL